jgi:type VI secretion system secreted protein Hcp
MIHLEIKGIEGDGKTAGFEGHIDCDSCDWAGANTADANSADGLTSATSSVEQMSLTAKCGLQTINVFTAALISKHIPKAILHFTKTVGGNKVLEWMTITMENCVISSSGMSFSAEDMGSETFTLAFEKFKAEYFIYDITGKKKNGSVLTYNVQTREKT